VWAAVTALTAGVIPWQAAVLAAGLLVIWSAVGLFTEWRSRRDLVAIVHAVPPGVIMIHWSGRGSRVLCLAWLSDAGQCEQQSRP
jgi:hypothetical protein